MTTTTMRCKQRWMEISWPCDEDDSWCLGFVGDGWVSPEMVGFRRRWLEFGRNYWVTMKMVVKITLTFVRMVLEFNKFFLSCSYPICSYYIPQRTINNTSPGNEPIFGGIDSWTRHISQDLHSKSQAMARPCQAQDNI